ncbi:alpha/beta hydrolase [Streptomyces violaceusniger]|uniref:alpha/beta hydrolase n=1 Tax=Streptomyces violaceusniger TaxID=68280 RepID=UPI0031DF7B18
MDYATLTSLNPSEFEDAAGGYRTVGDMAGQVKDDLEQQIAAGMRETLKGEAVDAAVVQLRKLATNFHYTQVECALIITALNSLAYELRAAKDKLDAAVADAEAEKFTVGADGSVSYPAGGDKVDGKVPEGGTVTGSAKGRPTNQPIDPTGDANDAAGALERQAANIHPNPNFGRAVAIANRIAQAVYDATQADEKWAPQLRKLKADDDLVVAAEDWADVQKDATGVRQGAKDYLGEIKHPPKHGSPEDNAKWWKGLSTQEKATYAAMYPDSLGTLNGIPADVRDEANRVLLAEKHGEYSMQLQAIPKEPNKYVDIRDAVPGNAYSGDWVAWDKKYGDKVRGLKAALKGMESIQDRFDRTGQVDPKHPEEKPLPKAYLLGFDTKGHGHAIVANGNPDKADHTAVYVPGTTSSLEKIGGDVGRMEKLWRASDGIAQGQNVSTITWLGYDAPQSVVTDAPKSSYADDGGPKLNDFVSGLRASHDGDSGHLTVDGHSYGSTVIGSAARQGHLAADDVFVAGSPGMQVGHASDLDVGEDHVWAADAGKSEIPWPSSDPVPEVGSWGHAKKDVSFEMPDVIPWLDGDGISGPADMNPTDENGIRIGVIRIDPREPTDPDFGGNIVNTDTSGHSGYWDEDSESLQNQAKVVVGRYGEVTRK